MLYLIIFVVTFVAIGLGSWILGAHDRNRKKWGEITPARKNGTVSLLPPAHPPFFELSFELASDLFREDVWLQMLVLRTRSGYGAAIMNGDRTRQVAGAPDSASPSAAIESLYVNLTLELEEEKKRDE